MLSIIVVADDHRIWIG